MAQSDSKRSNQPEGVVAAKPASNAVIVLQLFDILTGTSVFALPNAIYTTGWLPFLSAQLLFAFLSAATSLYLLQTMHVNARRPQTTAHDLKKRRKHQLVGDDEDEGEHSEKRSPRSSSSGDDRKENENSPLLSQSSPAKYGGGGSTSNDSADPLPNSSELLGLPHLCSHYGGKYLFYLYDVGIFIYLVSTLWAVCAVFTSQLSATVMALFYEEDCSIYNPEANSNAHCQYAYFGALSILTVLSVVWVMAGSPLSERLSNGVGIFRIIGFVLMIGTVLVALFTEHWPSSPSSSRSSAPLGALGMLPNDNRMLKGVSLAVVYALLSYNISFDMAEVFSPERWPWSENDQENQSQPRRKRSPATRASILMNITIVITLVFLVLISVVCAALFGDKGESLINLNWRRYEGRHFLISSASDPAIVSLWTSIPVWTRILQMVILIFPVVNAISSLPFLATAQAKSLTRFIAYDPEHAHASFIVYRNAPPPHFPGGNKSVALLCVLPPLILTGFIGDLGSIFLWTAPIALFVQYLLPAGLLLSTRYGPNAEPKRGNGVSEEDVPHKPATKSSVLILLLSVSLITSIATIVLLCLYPLW